MRPLTISAQRYEGLESLVPSIVDYVVTNPGLRGERRCIPAFVARQKTNAGILRCAQNDNIEESLGEGMDGERGAIVHTHLAHQASDMRLDGTLIDAKGESDLTVGMSLA